MGKATEAAGDPEYIQLRELTSDMRGLSSSDDTVDDTVDDPPGSLGGADIEAHSRPVSRWQRFVDGPEYPSNDPAPCPTWLLWADQPRRWFDARTKRWQKVALFVSYMFLWIGALYGLVMPYLVTPPIVDGDQLPVIVTGCQESGLWAGKNQLCGLNSTRCPGVSDLNEDFIIRCPALCNLHKQFSLMPIGDQRIKYRPYIVGGGSDITVNLEDDDLQLTNPYRADSNPCVAAAHAGLTSSLRGGVVKVSYRSGPQMAFASAAGKEGTGDSIAFDSYFPYSFYFKSLDQTKVSPAKDPRFTVVALNIIFGIPVTYLASAAATFWTVTTVAFWDIVFSEDPIAPINPDVPENFSFMVSKGCERFLPTCFILFVLYKYSVGITLGKPAGGPDPSPILRVLLWYPLFWIGALNNITFDRLPLDRFSWEAFRAQPGGVLSASILIGVILVGAVFQAYSIWHTGKFWQYLRLYLVMLAGLVVIILIPGLKFHLHHYILAMILLPGCGTRNVTGLMFSGLLLGLFISGASRWGLDSILETAVQWARSDPIGQIIPPMISNFNASTGELSWVGEAMAFTEQLSGLHNFTSVSLLINDVEMYQGNGTSVNLTRLLPQAIRMATDIPVYLRMARLNPVANEYSDYSNAAVLQWPSGNLTLPAPGLT
ncbi:hypothetical protein DIURU_001277 [Diutina rugosa]|uniref:Uncharacterized protein n=1 Tax=Diutina rugosa TaxID=5481 RepID=A0A642UUR7_DIURU|nr:uncharacterized protein DIURU_001277 [Diutina rugosa]KAA8905900.1 hypothetical protein DIURU_001277 [Diutina rugosa]